jgi:hypothetical protein
VCQRQIRAVKVLGFASDLFLNEQVSQANVFFVEGMLFVFTVLSFFDGNSK